MFSYATAKNRNKLRSSPETPRAGHETNLSGRLSEMSYKKAIGNLKNFVILLYIVTQQIIAC